MSLPASPTHRWQRWLLGFSIWTVLGLLSAVQTSIYFMRDGRPVPWTPVIIDRLADWYTCAIFTPLFFWLVRAIPWDRSRWWRPVGIQTLVALACVPIKYLMYAGIVVWLIPDYRPVVVGRLIVGNIVYEFMAFGVMFAVIHAVELNRRAMENIARAARLETRLAEARLETLTAQLQPHFLFNTLHAISTLMHRDVEAADTMLARLGDLLRRTLDDRNRPEVPLAEELRLLDAYLDIARVRFQDRLTVEVSVATDTNSALVPRFVLQPLVENALQHGIGSRHGRGRVTIEAKRVDGRLRLSVADDGPGIAPKDNGFPREGIGLTNTRERLRERYGQDHSLQLTQRESGGLLVAVDIPFRTAAA
jgi:two-component system LytT family sensor kinase